MPYCEARDKRQRDRIFSISTLANYHIITLVFPFHVQHTGPGGRTGAFYSFFNLFLTFVLSALK